MIMTTPLMDNPAMLNERIVCSVTAAVKFRVPAQIILAIAEKEGGKPGLWVRNKNGTHDVGVMQFNTRYLKDLERYGITADDVAQEGCFPYDLAALRIKGHLVSDSADIYTRAANYHSRTPSHNAVYRKDLIKKSQKWSQWLQANFLHLPTPEESGMQVSQKLSSSPAIHTKPVVHGISHLKPKPLPDARAALDSLYAVDRLEFYRKNT